MLGHIEGSVQLLEDEWLYPKLYSDGVADNFTVAIMLQEASYASGNPLWDALWVPFYSNPEQIEGLKLALHEASNASYARYWSGFLVILKPLLVLFDLKQIRALLSAITLLLLVIACMVLYRKLDRVGLVTAVSLGIAYGLFSMVEVSSILPFFSSIAISLLSIIVLLKICRADFGNLIAVFFIVGAVTVYSDFLDYPILTLGMPLLVLLARMLHEGRFFKHDHVSIRAPIILVALCCIAWVIGYGYLWALKWVLATLVTGADVFASAFGQAAVYAGAGEFSSTYSHPIIEAIRANYQAGGWRSKLILLLVGVYIVSIVVAFVRLRLVRKHASNEDRVPKDASLAFTSILIFMTSMLPYIWYMAFGAHSLIHAEIISYRDQVLSLAGLLMCVALSVMAISGLRNTGNERRKQMS